SAARIRSLFMFIWSRYWLTVMPCSNRSLVTTVVPPGSRVLASQVRYDVPPGPDPIAPPNPSTTQHREKPCPAFTISAPCHPVNPQVRSARPARARDLTAPPRTVLYACLGQREGRPMGSVDKVVTVVRNGILAGTWKPGASLPSARQLGEDLPANKNRGGKASGLRTGGGLPDVPPGRRARAAPSARRSLPAQDVFRGELRRTLEPALRSARMLGLRPEQVVQTINEELTSFYRMAAPQIVLVEGNRIDAQQHAADLASLLGTPASWALMQDLPSPRRADRCGDPYSDHDDVEDELAGARIIGLHTAPGPAVLLDMLTSAQQPGARVGLVCGNSKSAVRFAKLIEFYTTKSIEIT